MTQAAIVSSPVVVRKGSFHEIVTAKLGSAALHFEMTMYNFADRFSSDYKGSMWSAYELANGGFYVAPDLDTPLKCAWADNFFEGELSPDAFGVVVTKFALWYVAASTQVERHCDMWEFVDDVIRTHPESSKIYRAID